jgi:hypothetical protein
VSDWLAGLLVGVVGGLVFFLFPPFGIGVLVIFGLLAAGRGNRSFGLSGLLIGVGGSWVGLLVAANARCAQFNEVPNQECVAPDLTAWFVIGGCFLVLGAVLVLLGFRAGRRRP